MGSTPSSAQGSTGFRARQGSERLARRFNRCFGAHRDRRLARHKLLAPAIRPRGVMPSERTTLPAIHARRVDCEPCRRASTRFALRAARRVNQTTSCQILRDILRRLARVSSKFFRPRHLVESWFRARSPMGELTSSAARDARRARGIVKPSFSRPKSRSESPEWRNDPSGDVEVRREAASAAPPPRPAARGVPC
jgi:hypothetical protein